MTNLATEFPMIVSLPPPPIAFSIIVPRPMLTFPTSPPTLENVSGLRLMTCAWVNPACSSPTSLLSSTVTDAPRSPVSSLKRPPRTASTESASSRAAVPITIHPATSPVTTQVGIDKSIPKAFRQHLLFVVVATAKNSRGEIRGQLG